MAIFTYYYINNIIPNISDTFLILLSYSAAESWF